MDWESLSNFVIPNTDVTMKCKLWMKHFFNLVGDKMPNTYHKEIHLDCMPKNEIHEEYVCNMKNWFGDEKGQYLSST